jgi:hypothetical protein
MQKYLKICSYLINKKNEPFFHWTTNFKTSKFQAISKFQKFQNISKFLKFSTKFKILKYFFLNLSSKFKNFQNFKNNSLLKTIDASIDHRGAKNAKISENM